MKRLLVILFLFMPLRAIAQDAVPLVNPLIADLSQNTVEIRTSFNGSQLLVFGAQNIPGELVIAVRGPETNVNLRRKERIAGMWLNVEQHKYENLPLFYGIASTHALSQIASPEILQSLGLGVDSAVRNANMNADEVFDRALIAALEKRRWWQAPFATITYFGESLFKARIDLPDTLPRGEYTAEVYLFDNGKLAAFQTIPLLVSTTGFDAWITDAAREQGVLYGIGSVLLALLGGWLAHRLFNRG